jgi:hypothetical protein
MSYRGMVHDIEAAMPARPDCIASRNLGESQRGIFEYFGGIVTEREENPAARRNCDLLLVQTLAEPQPQPGPAWRLIWDGARPGDNREHFWLFHQTR